MQGSFGVVRSIETTGEQANATGQPFLVNVIFQESWFNITGVNGGNFFDGAGVGATHNETWDYQVVQSDWDNRTVRLVWRETGPDASEGDELPEHSPVQQNATAPSSEEGLGDLTVGKETGWMPIPMQTGDRLRLNGQDGITLTACRPNGFGYEGRTQPHRHRVDRRLRRVGEDGNASGGIGLRGAAEGFAFECATATFVALRLMKTKRLSCRRHRCLGACSLQKSLARTTTTLPPSVNSGLREGLVLGEGGAIAHLEVEVSDTEWNIARSQRRPQSIGMGVVELNDRGLGVTKPSVTMFTQPRWSSRASRWRTEPLCGGSGQFRCFNIGRRLGAGRQSSTKNLTDIETRSTVRCPWSIGRPQCRCLRRSWRE